MSEIRKPSGATKAKKIRGKGVGTGLGKTGGRGTKGQNSRSGGGVRLGFEGGQMPLYRRIARRGFSNYRFKTRFTEVSLSHLEKFFDTGDTVNLQSLIERGVVRKSTGAVKILGNGKLETKLTVEGVFATASARARIVEAGGTFVEAATEANGTE